MSMWIKRPARLDWLIWAQCKCKWTLKCWIGTGVVVAALSVQQTHPNRNKMLTVMQAYIHTQSTGMDVVCDYIGIYVHLQFFQHHKLQLQLQLSSCCRSDVQPQFWFLQRSRCAFALPTIPRSNFFLALCFTFSSVSISCIALLFVPSAASVGCTSCTWTHPLDHTADRLVGQTARCAGIWPPAASCWLGEHMMSRRVVWSAVQWLIWTRIHIHTAWKLQANAAVAAAWFVVRITSLSTSRLRRLWHFDSVEVMDRMSESVWINSCAFCICERICVRSNMCLLRAFCLLSVCMPLRLSALLYFYLPACLSAFCCWLLFVAGHCCSMMSCSTLR